MSRYDYIVVGAGSAGCVLAARLSEDPDIRVLLLESGGNNRSLFVNMPSAFALAMKGKRRNWGFETEPEPQQSLPFDPTLADAPLCAECGGLMTRNGSCYKCENCGSTSGCS